jgi:Spx/MgsR family transcriptional regulator
MSLIVHGIPNCNTVKKARAWLEERGRAYTFHDLRKQGVPEAALDSWVAALGWQKLVNRKGTTWRQLDEATQTGVVDTVSACALMLGKPAVIKRPVVQWPGGAVTVGFDADEWAGRI